jgi:pimeloyl-ACP methyl ester carboxylesterase
MNSVMWMGDAIKWAPHFHLHAIDLIGEPGFSAPSRPALSSDAYALWLDDVLAGLSIERATFVGTSFGGWIALDYAIRRPRRVSGLALLCPAGIGRQKLAIVFQTVAMRLLGARGRERLKRKILGGNATSSSPAMRAFAGFVALIHEHFRPRIVKIPVFSDAALGTLRVPVLAIVGGTDVLLDSRQTQQRLLRSVQGVDVRLLPHAGHAITGQSEAVLEFLQGPRLNDPVGTTRATERATLLDMGTRRRVTTCRE